MPAEVELANVASELRVVLGQLVRRLRSENGLPLSHVSVLSRLERTGSQTTSRLAAAARMRPQSMAHTLGELENAGLVKRSPDAVDRRQILIGLTEAGHEFLAVEWERRESWLANAIAEELTRAEQQLLVKAFALLRRLAEL
jgi:DNA-binding MarR family transcriptional regulator